ncbi:MAG: histidine--tRNA ligase [Patescibacteria group bacterium]
MKTKKPTFQSVKGMHDILPQDQLVWDKMRQTFKNVVEHYNFSRIDTPILEKADLFTKGVGQNTDIVEKQMFSFETSGKEILALRPENTASIARAYIQHGLSRLGQPLKLYYLGPMFRHENPQEGRYRQFYQAGVEILGGDSDAIYDAQSILVMHRVLEELKLGKLNVQINTIGCRVCRPLYRKKLQAFYKNKAVCKNCKARSITNPLRLLDCKEKECQVVKKDAPTVLDSICSYCNSHFRLVLEYLDELKLSYTLNNNLVRGLDYYNKTVFEVFVDGLDFALAGGGRYDYLLESLGGRHTPAVGWSMGLERILLAIQKNNITFSEKPKANVFFVHMGDEAKKKSLSLIESLRQGKIQVKESLGKDSLRSQLRMADRVGAKLALIFGQKEAFEDSIIIRDLETGAQETVLISKLVEEVKKRV